PEPSSDNPYVQAQTEQELQLSATKEKISIPPTKMANEKRNFPNQDYTTEKIEDNKKSNTQKNKKRKNKKGTHENDIVMTEATTSGQGFSSH
ncbi:11119_t:CDS:2, partial [Scutellospora calospora]